MPVVKKQNVNWYQRFTTSIVFNTEYFFYRLGCNVGRHPKRTIALCWGLVLLSSVGFLRFHQEKNPMKLWVPPGTAFLRDTEWLLSRFQRGYRTEVALISAPDVLSPEVLRKLLSIHQQIENAEPQEKGTGWKDVCFRIPKVEKQLLNLLGNTDDGKDPSASMNAALFCSFVESMKLECYEKSILGLWDFDEDKIDNLTKSEIVEAINTEGEDDILGAMRNYTDLLGGIQYNSTGHIVGATTLHNLWMVNVDFSTVDMDKVGNIAGTADWASLETLVFENEFLSILENISKNATDITVDYTSSRSFGDISSKVMFQDMGILCIGVFMMVIYVLFVISKFNWLEARVVLGGVGLLTVGMSFVVGCGFCSLLGISYGPVHTSLPFLLMGLGVDDMFVIMACWEELTKDQKKLPIFEQTGLMLKHGGVSITVTSVTDILAFLVGSYTILPCLQSYCFYAAFGVLMTYVYAVTFFTACFALDQARIAERRNGVVTCYRHGKDYKVNSFSQRQTSNKVFEFVYSNAILTRPGKVLVLVITATCLGLSAESALKLETRFDPEWFVPKTSHFHSYLQMRKQYYPTHGFEAGIYMGSINYAREINNIKRMSDELIAFANYTTNVVSWVDPFRDYVAANFNQDPFAEEISEERFDTYLSMFLFSPMNAKYQANFQFETGLECGAPAPKIVISSINFNFHQFHGPEEHLPAMHAVQAITERSNFTTGDRFATVWSKVFATWTTDDVIYIEVVRNLQLALICVMAVTVILIADIQTCLWIFLCVLLTMVNVCGFMYRWGLTIDLVSCIGLELAIGLCVDYATHIGHTFLTVQNGDRYQRSLKTVSSIGSAVVYGGLSTFIGVFMLSQSDAFIFQSFFKIFLLVIIFGLFHGVVLLPVILSIIGPKPYRHREIVPQSDNNATEMT